MGPLVLLAVSGLSSSVCGGFAVSTDGANVTITENGSPVLVYRHGPVDPPEGVDARYRRAGYIHPLYSVDGDVLTQDFPSDHYHHRGVFWTWPECTVGDRRIDVWALDGARPQPQNVEIVRVDAQGAELVFDAYWAFDDSPTVPQVGERVAITVHPAQGGNRSIDFHITMSNPTQETVTFLGAANKGYGGLCFRPDSARKPMHFTADSGPVEEDQLSFDTPWADVSFRLDPEAPPQAGVAVFQHPANPGYPHPGWIFRHYSFLGASWPHEETHALAPGESFELRYRMFVHRGSAGEANVAEAFAAYTRAMEGAGKP